MSDLFHKDVPDEYIGAVFKVMHDTPQHTYQILTKRHGRMRSLLRRWAAEGILPVTEYEDDLITTTTYDGVPWPLPNVWLGVSVEDQQRADLRIPALLDTPAAVRFLSCEPLIGPVMLRNWVLPHCGCCTPLPGRPCVNDPGALSVDWVIGGGESGPGARPMHPNWARSLRDQCADAEVAFHFKQWGEWGPAGLGIGMAQHSTGREVLVGDPVDNMGHRQVMRRVGKKDAGRTLDGLTHDEFPEVHGV